MTRSRTFRTKIVTALAAAGSMAVVGLLSAAGPAVELAHAATGPVACDGTGTTVESGLESIAGATLQDHTPVGDSGPNLVLNGDFTYADDDSAQTNLTAVNGLTNSVTAPIKAIKYWAATGGGTDTYAAWGAGVNWFWHSGLTPPPASPSMVYFGNGPFGRYLLNSGTFAFNADGFGQGDITPIPQPSPGDFGTTATPVAVTQTVSGLTVGTRYRLQFFVASENSTDTPDSQPYGKTGLAAVEITGYTRTYFSVLAQDNRYLTIDFVATSAATTVSFESWAHILILGPPNTSNPSSYGDGATELVLDDVILTECQPGTPVPPVPPGPRPTPGGDPAVDPTFTG